MRIESHHVKKLGKGIIYVLVNTDEKWHPYQVNKYTPEKDGSITVTLFEDENDVEGKTETIDIFKGFNPFDYIITTNQEKDQITVVLMPVEFVYPNLKMHK